ncbi:MAG: dockerin type I repeat-containing protein [Bacteroidales bacterium]|nr:dockerin type I repeat-containing protein [Clostridium sp.]MCM1204676.1 dockerin type I repeat-containing protein [Bacteroidales bacterium]
MIKGDINNDGLVNQKDAKMLQRALLGTLKLTEEQEKAADMDDDVQLTKKDLEQLKDLLALRITGDANGDGYLTEDDVLTIQKHVAEILKLDDRLLENADINADGGVDMRDVIMLQKIIAGIIADNEARKPKNNKVTISLESFNKGEYLSWFVTTQAAYEVTVTLKDDKKVYFTGKKKGTDIEPPLAVGNCQYTGKNLTLEISIPESEDIKAIPSMSTIITNTGKVVGQSFTCCGEDWTDNNYSDFYISVVGWKKK